MDNQYRSTSIYGALVCGIIVLAVGICLAVSNSTIEGLTLPSKGVTPWQRISLGGIALIALGTLICAYPIYSLIRNYIRTNNRNR